MVQLVNLHRSKNLHDVLPCIGGPAVKAKAGFPGLQKDPRSLREMALRSQRTSRNPFTRRIDQVTIAGLRRSRSGSGHRDGYIPL